MNALEPVHQLRPARVEPGALPVIANAADVLVNIIDTIPVPRVREREMTADDAELVDDSPNVGD